MQSENIDSQGMNPLAAPQDSEPLDLSAYQPIGSFPTCKPSESSRSSLHPVKTQVSGQNMPHQSNMMPSNIEKICKRLPFRFALLSNVYIWRIFMVTLLVRGVLIFGKLFVYLFACVFLLAITQFKKSVQIWTQPSSSYGEKISDF